MAEPPLTQEEIGSYQAAIGRTEERAQLLDSESLRRFAAAIGEAVEAAPARMPSLGHWAWFLEPVPADRLGGDGHARRGGFLPAVRLGRRMFGGGTFRFSAPLEPDRPALLRAVIADVRHRAGKGGDLVLVDVDRTITQGGSVRVEERQTIVFLAGGRPTAAPVLVAETGSADLVWRPSPVDLFRFSAVTFNGHRIHYDQAYTRDVELYPDLVVHGPFTAVRLFALAASKHAVARFTFRAVAPLFVDQPIRLRAAGTDNGTELAAVRCDGVIAMTAEAASGA